MAEMVEPQDCDHPTEVCTEGKCHMCGWVYDKEYVSPRVQRDEAVARAERAEALLERLAETGDWYVRCLEDVQDRRPVRGFTEAKLGWTEALAAVREHTEKENA